MGADGHMTIASVDPLQIGEHINRILDWYRGRQPRGEAICWYLSPVPPGDLGAQLFARGFTPNWQPHWMWCDLRYFHRNHPSTFDIQIIENEPTWQVDDLPNYNPHDAPVLAALHRAYPDHAPSLVAFQEHQIVGRCMLNVTAGQVQTVRTFLTYPFLFPHNRALRLFLASVPPATSAQTSALSTHDSLIFRPFYPPIVLVVLERTCLCICLARNE